MENINKLLKIGILQDDDENVILRKQFMLYQGFAMSIGGVLWGSLALFFGYPIPSLISYGYVVVTVFNFLWFSKTKNFVLTRNVQTIISMFLPFGLQWLLGGFAFSGTVMIWALLALVLSITYQSIKSSIFWLSIYVIMIGISFAIDDYFVQNFNLGVSPFVSKVFHIANILTVSVIILLLFLYFVKENAINIERVKQTYNKLITAEKLAVLGQISAGVAHEVNTPLGAIKSSAEESSQAFMEILIDLIWLTKNLTDKEKDAFVEFVAHSNPHSETLSTAEEREIKKKMKLRFEELGIENSRFIADRLVQVGIYEVSPDLENISKLPHFEKLMMITYNILNQQRCNQTIQLAVDKASRIVKALKTYMHNSDHQEAESINLRDNLETVLTIYHNRLKQGIEVIKNYQEVPQVFGHPDQLNQVWTNLIVNSIQAMGSSGILTIGIKRDENYVVVSISDNGEGMSPETQNKIFTPFFTTKISGEGSGLGLGIVKQILYDHHASISFESKEGLGTTFFVKLPIKQI